MKEQYLLDCPGYLKDYLNYVSVVRNHSECTVNSYYIDLRIFLRYLKVTHGISDFAHFDRLRIDDVPLSWLENFSLVSAYDYMSYLLVTRHNSSLTRFRRTTSLKCFYEYLYKSHLISCNSISDLEHPKRVYNLPKYLTLEQSMKILDLVDGKHQERNFCIILLFLSCGMRLSELVGLNIDDYCESTRTLRIFGKGRKERIVYINNACIAAINNYLAVRPRSELEPRAFFLSHSLTRISIRQVQRIVEKQLDICGFSNLGITVHKLRHTAATLMYEAGVDLISLKEILGHSSVASTQIYTHISDIDRKRAAEISPFANVCNKNNFKI